MTIKDEAVDFVLKSGGATYALTAAVLVLAVSWLIGKWKHQGTVSEQLTKH